MAVGPTAGGFLIDHYGWRSIFYLVVPFGIGALALTFIGIAESSDPKKRKVYWLGQLFAVLTLGPLAFALIQGPVSSWTSPLIVSSLLVFVVCFISFIIVERRARIGLVSLDVFQSGTFSAVIGITALTTFCFYGFQFVFPLYLQKVRGLSAGLTGVELLPLSLAFFFISFFAGSFLKRFGPRMLITIGMAVYGAGILFLALRGAQSGYATMLLSLSLIGLGIGLTFGPIMIVAVSSVAKERSGMSSGLVNVARMVGATLGVAILGLIFGAQAIQSAAGAEFANGVRNVLLIGGCAVLAGAIIALAFIKREIPKEA